MGPAHQGFEADDLAVVQAYLGLQEDRQPVFLQGLDELLQQVEIILDAGQHLRTVDAEGLLFPLGGVQHRLRQVQHLLGRAFPFHVRQVEPGQGQADLAGGTLQRNVHQR